MAGAAALAVVATSFIATSASVGRSVGPIAPPDTLIALKAAERRLRRLCSLRTGVS
jgi:hypothetical protein